VYVSTVKDLPNVMRVYCQMKCGFVHKYYIKTWGQEPHATFHKNYNTTEKSCLFDLRSRTKCTQRFTVLYNYK